MAINLPESNCLMSAMKALSSDQLISIIGQMVIIHPDMEQVDNFVICFRNNFVLFQRGHDILQEIRTRFPKADLKPLEERIYYLRRNIYKALPSSRLISKTDATAYNRVSTHVLAFKVSLTMQCQYNSISMCDNNIVCSEMCDRSRQTLG